MEVIREALLFCLPFAYHEVCMLFNVHNLDKILGQAPEHMKRNYATLQESNVIKHSDNDTEEEDKS